MEIYSYSLISIEILALLIISFLIYKDFYTLNHGQFWLFLLFIYVLQDVFFYLHFLFSLVVVNVMEILLTALSSAALFSIIINYGRNEENIDLVLPVMGVLPFAITLASFLWSHLQIFQILTFYGDFQTTELRLIQFLVLAPQFFLIMLSEYIYLTKIKGVSFTRKASFSFILLLIFVEIYLLISSFRPTISSIISINELFSTALFVLGNVLLFVFPLLYDASVDTEIERIYIITKSGKLIHHDHKNEKTRLPSNKDILLSGALAAFLNFSSEIEILSDQGDYLELQSKDQYFLITPIDGLAVCIMAYKLSKRTKSKISALVNLSKPELITMNPVMLEKLTHQIYSVS